MLAVTAILFLCLSVLNPLSGCAPTGTQSLSGLEGEPTHSLELDYANQFSADFYEDGSALLTVAGSERYWLVPPGGAAPGGLDEDITVLQLPLDNLYVAASAAMDSFRQLDALGDVSLTSTTLENWAIPEVRQAMDDGTIQYVGKYNSPDYEMILTEGSDLAIESTMIFHNPETQEQLESLGIPVIVERSSYEPSPLGRLEWIKFYGLLTGRLPEAEAFFDDQVAQLQPILSQDSDENGPTVAFFYISSNGSAIVRKPGDYLTKMIEMAGGRYILEGVDSEEENNLSTMNMQMEAFYDKARDADIIIYNSTIDDELNSMDDFLQKSELLSQFKAVREGNVWGTGKNLYQQTTDLGALIQDLHQVISGQADTQNDLTFLHRLR